MSALTLTLPMPPSSNRYWRVVRGYVVLSPEARAYKLLVGNLARLAKVRPFAGPVSVHVTVYRERRAGDLDNRLKVALDALNKHAWEDDSQVVELHAVRRDDKARPRVEVVVRPAEEVGNG